jgi:hypothetical protein
MWDWAHQESGRAYLSYTVLECLPTWKKLLHELQAANLTPGFSSFDEFYKVWLEKREEADTTMRSVTAQSIVEPGSSEQVSEPRRSTSATVPNQAEEPGVHPMISNDQSCEGGDLIESTVVTPSTKANTEAKAAHLQETTSARSEGTLAKTAMTTDKSTGPDSIVAAGKAEEMDEPGADPMILNDEAEGGDLKESTVVNRQQRGAPKQRTLVYRKRFRVVQGVQ